MSRKWALCMRATQRPYTRPRKQFPRPSDRAPVTASVAAVRVDQRQSRALSLSATYTDIYVKRTKQIQIVKSDR